ncbi:Transcription elongation factor spt5 [Exophiala dermatitidis]
MAASGQSWLNQDFGGDDEESDNDFNPGVEMGSDAEQDAEEDSKPQIKTQGGAPASDDESTAGQKTNGKRSASPTEEDRKVAPANEDDDEEQDAADEEDDNEGKEADGEDDEGEGEDLNGDEDEEGDEDEDEDEEEEDEDAVSSRPRKRRRRGLNQFFEEEAEVDEDDDELEAEEDDLGPEFIQDTHPDDDLPPEADHDDRRHRELDRQRQLQQSLDAEQEAAKFRERYGRRTTTALSNTSFVPQNLLMPDVNDPSIWGVRCKAGKEKEIIHRLMKKFVESQGSRNPMRICSAFERGDGPMAGYIFVEARRKVDVDDALTNVADVYPRSKMNLVPVKEMPDLLRVNKSKELEVGGYVRIKRGLYQGDLGMIESVETNGLEVTVRLVPRLTYGMDEDQQRPGAADAKRKRPNAFGGLNSVANRPPQRLFNENEARKRHDRFLQQNRGLTGRSWSYKGELYEDGFLIKDFKLQHLLTDNVNPRLDEITKLTKTAADGSELLDLESLAHSLRNTAAEGSYLPGDEVEVYEGEQKGIVGRIEAVTGNIISIMVTEGELTGQLVEVPVKGLRKRFREGDNVKIIGGSKYRDEVGMVLRIKDDKVTVLTNESNDEITVFSKDLREATDAGGAGAGASKFDVQDLVQIDSTTAGCVIRSDRESVRILDQNGSVTTRIPSQLMRIEARRNAVATDKNGSEIRVGDVVRESGGEGKSGTILHIHRGFVFAHNKLNIENAGIWVARCSNVITTAAKGGRITAPATDLSKMNPALQLKRPDMSMAPPQRPGRDPLQGRFVHINKGPYKGHRALVKDTTAGEARLELQTKNKTINVSKFDLSVVDTNTQNKTRYEDWIRSRGGPSGMRAGQGMPGSRIPDSGFGGRTPMGVMDGGRTPAWGAASRTPAWGGPNSSSALESGRTPAWKGPSGSQTAYGGGGLTSYGGPGNYSTTGSRTPAWTAGAKTPYGADHGFGSSNNSGFDAFAAGSRTPAYTASSSRTPAWGGPGASASAPTPAARSYDAPTPGISAPTPAASGHYDDDAYTPYLGAPTPGAGPVDAPTPAPSFAKNANKEPLKHNRLAAFDAPTPVASAPTPYASGAFDAPTPAAGGPRYADDDDDQD